MKKLNLLKLNPEKTGTIIKIYKWVEYLFFTFLIVMAITAIHPLLLAVIGIITSYLLKDNIDRYFKYTISYLMWIYVLSHYVIIKNNSSFLYFEFVNFFFLFIILFVIKNYNKGKTIW